MDNQNVIEDSKKPLLQGSLESVTREENVNKIREEENGVLTPKGSFLKYQEHWRMRSCLIGLALGLFFHLGGGYYSFPMWLNVIITKSVDLSRGELALLGGSTYVSLGVCGIFVMWLTSQNFFKGKINEFKVLSSVGALFVVSAYSYLCYLVLSPDDGPGHNVVAVGFTMAIYGFGVGSFYMVWFSPVLAIINDEWKFLYIALSNVMFSVGATVSLSLKLALPDEYWMVMMLLAQATMLFVIITFTFRNHKVLFIPEPVPTAADGAKHKSHAASTRHFIWQLATFQRNLSPAQLVREACDLTSKQFYFIFTAFVLVNATSTTFMANIGPLTSNDSDTDGSDRSQIVVLILSTVGQCIGRSLVPLITYYMARHYEAIQIHKQSGPRAAALRQSRLLNRTTLLFTLGIGLIFTISLLCVKFVSGADFVVESTIISVGYGAMWCVTSSFPAFLHNQDQSFVLSFQQVLGALSTLICVLIVSILQFDNGETFTFLLVLSVATVIAAALAFVERVRAEPTRAQIREYEPVPDGERSYSDSDEETELERASAGVERTSTSIRVSVTDSPFDHEGSV